MYSAQIMRKSVRNVMFFVSQNDIKRDKMTFSKNKKKIKIRKLNSILNYKFHDFSSNYAEISKKCHIFCLQKRRKKRNNDFFKNSLGRFSNESESNTDSNFQDCRANGVV